MGARWDSGRRSSMAWRRLRGVAAMLPVVVALSACSGPARGIDDAPVVPTASPAVSAAPSAASPIVDPEVSPTPDSVASVTRPDAGVLPRSLGYGVLVWTVKDAAITNGDPNRYVNDDPGPPTAKTSLILDFDIRNDNVVVGIVMNMARLVVTLPDGTAVMGRNLAKASVPPVSSAEGRYGFEVPAGTGFDGLVLSIADPGREPSADLPLSGPPPAVETNSVVDLHGALDPKIPKVAMTWNVNSQIIGRDWPLPVGFKGGAMPASTRSETGQRWLGLVARVQVGACDCKGGVLDQTGSARLFVDGVPISAASSSSTAMILMAESISDVMLVFAVPASAKAATLQVGPLDRPEEQDRLGLELD
jgi:hypothetical protein